MTNTRSVAADGTGQTTSERATVLFVRMWATAHALHLLIANGNALNTPWNVAVVALAIGVLLRPETGRLFAAMLVAQLVEYVVEMPLGPDHWALISLVNVAILLTMVSARSTSPSTLARAFPAARALLLIAYGAAAISKWNTSFLDPVTSCANAIAKVVSFGLVAPLGDSPLLSYGAMATESLVLVLLVIPATRRWGVILGLLFHFSLSASPVMAVSDFTSTVYALFLLFLRPGAVDALLDRATTWMSRSAIVRDVSRRPRAFAAVAFVVLGFGGYALPAVAYATMYVAAQAYFLVLLAAAITTAAARGAGSRLGRPLLVQAPALVLAVLWALNPYLGLRTTGTFTMFSNLRTESPHPNHLFMPSWRITDWQDDMVRLTSANDDQLAAGAENGLSVPLVALRRMSMDDPGLEVTGVLDGTVVTWGTGKGETRLEPLPWWVHKAFLLRPVSADDRPFCAQS